MEPDNLSRRIFVVQHFVVDSYAGMHSVGVGTDCTVAIRAVFGRAVNNSVTHR